MKILLVNPTIGGMSGTGRHVDLLRRGLGENGLAADVLSTENSWFIDLPLLRSASFTAGLFTRLSGYDVFHFHSPKLAPLAARVKRSIITIHGGLEEFRVKYGAIGSLAALTMRALVKEASAVTTVMRYEAERNGWRWIPNMVDVSSIDEIEESGERCVLFVGRNDPVKNYELFRKVVSGLGVRYRALGVEEVRPWRGVISYMKSAECLLITSRWEGMPSVLLEAWAARCPVIASDIPAFRPFAGALILAEQLPSSFIEAYRRLGERRSSIVAEGRRYAEAFDYRRVVKEYLRLYDEVLSS